MLDDPIIITFMQEGTSFVTTLVVGRTYAQSKITTADAGDYSCEAGHREDSVTVVITATGDSGNISAQDQVAIAKLAPIIGISLAAFLAFMAIATYLLYRKKRSAVEDMVQSESMYTSKMYFISLSSLTMTCVFLFQT